jgi:histidine ammonia-lyase
MQHTHSISPARLSWQQLKQIGAAKPVLTLSDESRDRIQQSRRFLERQLAGTDQLFYGINTGFGALCNVRISNNEIEELQHNLVQSHACGMGAEVPPGVVRWMLLLKIQSLAYGYSGVRLELVERLIDFYNHNVLPVIYQQGSLGASGDLAPLAHLSLPLVGLGEVWYHNQKRPAGAVLQQLQLKPLQFQAKEALALLNGTQFSTAYAVWCVLEALRLGEIANLCAALSLDVFDCRTEPFAAILQHIRPHPGQVHTAEQIRRLRQGSILANRPKTQVQDPYAFRCVPQVHGASRDALAHVQAQVGTEVNSVTDNPNIFAEDNVILSGGNFHAQSVALVLDYLAIAIAELASISERRTYQLLSGTRGLPPFLTQHAGLHSGLMIAQYTAASMVSQNKQWCTPASVDSIVSSNGQEDHVSMAANAATKAFQVVQNAERVLAIEWMTAAQALEFRRPAQTSPFLENLVALYRTEVAKLTADRILSKDMHTTVEFLKKSYSSG